MRQASKRIPESAEKTVRDIRRATRRHHSAEEKIQIVLEGLRGEVSIAELCRKGDRPDAAFARHSVLGRWPNRPGPCSVPARLAGAGGCDTNATERLISVGNATQKR